MGDSSFPDFMEKIPAETMEAALKLRAANGLEATKEALVADLEKSGASWKLEETLRYRKAGASPFYISGRYLTAYGTCPATGEKDTKEKKAKAGTASTPRAIPADGKINEEAFYKVLHAKGFKIKISRDLLTNEIETVIPESISKLELKFSAIPANTSAVHVTQTTPQIQVSLTLEKFLELAGIRP